MRTKWQARKAQAAFAQCKATAKDTAKGLFTQCHSLEHLMKLGGNVVVRRCT